ncbi:MAG: Cell division protein ftsW [Candidatus Falkowbacteria bacterium GW2011_GWA2_39_24]|uniref:Probable peptidoglycan glycosyltransferase FtsW n=1 Tax=Candidatus Falkowbacteria bacterium GW2011_GWA2_39_24 TaxID=1618634 RepID=A0A0G0NGD8_9BACT|nr:MAG: Cell division protein ftsW [Candidatus Falkowbacteria bacterium GW2011_GWA2_39_24]
MTAQAWRQKIVNIWEQLIEQSSSDKVLVTVVALIIIIGLIMLFSASSVVAYNTYSDSYFFLKQQILALVLGLVAFWLLSKFNYQYLRKFALVALIISLGLLLLSLIPGLSQEVHGAKSWVKIFNQTFQPSEFVKLTFLIYLSAWFAGKQEKYRQVNAEHKSTPFFILFAVIALLMLAQPDLGTLVIITISSFTVYFLSGGRIKYIIIWALIGLLALGTLLAIPRFVNQKNRFLCAMDTSYSPDKYCYQLSQSLIAVGSGGWLGRGLGASRQKFLYLPEVQNDFIFAIIGEELGFIFSTIIVLLFFVLFYRGYLIAKHINDDFGRNLAMGIVTWLTIQVIINIGGIIGLIPMTGVPLPFISYGGTAILSGLAALGILVNISKQVKY